MQDGPLTPQDGAGVRRKFPESTQSALLQSKILGLPWGSRHAVLRQQNLHGVTPSSPKGGRRRLGQDSASALKEKPRGLRGFSALGSGTKQWL